MEFNEKLQELRKNRGLTQEELAEALYVSRTAVSKWESGRGYPSIDSLKEISSYFSVTIDDLLSGEKLISIAQKENKTNIRSLCSLLFGTVDLFSVILVILPLYPRTVDGHIYSVSLFSYTETAPFICWAHWVLFLFLVGLGAVKILLTKFKAEKQHNIVTGVSMGLGVLTVLFLAMTREAYAIITAFLLLVIKGILVFRCLKTK
ncbi:MAG: helix-turn-helix transcriptional regulator [Ruminococcaceae bacterium]|nr:helix-turn-helix transcriptional regulator [Oscillospiraceae bacterium]